MQCISGARSLTERLISFINRFLPPRFFHDEIYHRRRGKCPERTVGYILPDRVGKAENVHKYLRHDERYRAERGYR